jgi:hypothetical protein
MSKTLVRFVMGMVIGVVVTSLFTNDARIVMVVAVLCGVTVDKLLKED